MNELPEKWAIALLDGAIAASGHKSCQNKESSWMFRFAGAQYRAQLETRDATNVNYIRVRKSYQHVRCWLEARIKWGTPMMFCKPMRSIDSTTKLAHEDWEKQPDRPWISEYFPGANIDQDS